MQMFKLYKNVLEYTNKNNEKKSLFIDRNGKIYDFKSLIIEYENLYDKTNDLSKEINDLKQNESMYNLISQKNIRLISENIKMEEKIKTLEKSENIKSILKELINEIKNTDNDTLKPFQDDYFKDLSYKDIAELAKKSIRLTTDNRNLQNKLDEIKDRVINCSDNALKCLILEIIDRDYSKPIF